VDRHCGLNPGKAPETLLADLRDGTLAERYGCRYLSRSERHHAKAGNLNAGLAASSGELVAVFDADFVPQQHFLERTIGLLADPQTALVQTPQVFFNADPLMRNLAMERWMLPDEDSFYRWIEPVRSAWGAVVCAGTAFVARRAALDQVDGFCEAALSEDFVTGVALLGHGWRVRYLGEPLSAGLAAETMLDFVRQRQRWAAGTLQSLRLPQGPLRQRGLGLGQRLALLEGCLHWLNHLPRLLLLLMPLSYGLLGIVPIVVSQGGLLTRLLPLWLAVLLSVGWINRRSRHALLNES
jgi:cellulose synthase (UDP-forming)